MKWECQSTVWLPRGYTNDACHFDEIHRPLEGSSTPSVLATIQGVSMYFMTIRETRDLPWEGTRQIPRPDPRTLHLLHLVYDARVPPASLLTSLPSCSLGS